MTWLKHVAIVSSGVVYLSSKTVVDMSTFLLGIALMLDKMAILTDGPKPVGNCLKWPECC